MKQSKLMSLIEAIVSILVGFGISVAAQAFFLPLLGVAISWHANLSFALIMTVISIARQFVMRRIFEALHIRRPLSPFMQAVVAERFRQIEAEGFDLSHDDKHRRGELAAAGAVYALHGQTADIIGKGAIGPLCFWPWDDAWWKPQDVRRNLVKACALILAEGEKFDRARMKRRAS